MTVIGMLLLIVFIAFAALIAMKVVPMYIQYYTIKSTIESIRKEPQLAQMSPDGHSQRHPEALRYWLRR